MLNELKTLFTESGFMPHIHCYLSKPSLVWTMFVSDMLIGLAYVAIAITLWALIKKIKLPFNFIVFCFGIFILACGLTHFMEVWTLWNPDYWWSAGVKIVTAIASAGTGFYLLKLRHPIFTVAEAAKLSEQRRLDLEVLTKSLEQRVEERTKEVLEGEERFRTFANAMPQMTWMANSEGKIFWFNRRWYEYTGSSLEEADQIDFWKRVLVPNEHSHILEEWQTSIQTGKPFDMEFRIKAADGQFRWFLTRIEPFRDRQQKIVQWFATSTYIEDQRQVLKRLEEAVESRDEFLSIASHELRTPITSIKILMQMMKRGIRRGDTDTFSPERVKNFVDQSDRQVDKLVRLVEDMLDISRISLGKLHLTLETVHLRNLVQEVVERLQPQFEVAHCPVSVVGDQEIVGKWDRIRIEQVLVNLFTNAIRYGAGKPVVITLERKPFRAIVKVQDQGIGIPKESQERIFERFERAISANEVSGLGLGLYIVRQILEMHEGSISVDSEPAHGATFIVSLPLSS